MAHHQLIHKGRGKIVQDRDESVLVGAWVTWHLFVDSCHAILRGALKHWYRHCLYDDISKRKAIVEKVRGASYRPLF